MDWSDVLKLALSIFLVVTGLGLGYLFVRMAGVFARTGTAITRVTDEVVPILTRAQTTVDSINLELARVDEMMQTAVNATKGAERTVQTVSSAVTAPVRKLTGVAAGVREGIATLKARRAQEKADRKAADSARAAAATSAVTEAAVGGPVPPPGPTDAADTGSMRRPRHESPY
jgi:hypothetical protein